MITQIRRKDAACHGGPNKRQDAMLDYSTTEGFYMFSWENCYNLCREN